MADPWRRLVLAILVALAPAAAAAPTYAQAQGDQQVLVLYSTRPDAQLSIVGERDLPHILERGLEQRNIVYYSEFMDPATFPERAHNALHEFLRLKYEGIRFDLVIAIQNEAIEFLERHRATLFRDTPAVFLSNDPAVARLANSTGLIHERDFTSTVAFIHQLQPDLRHLFVVTGLTTSGERRQAAAIRALQPMYPGVEFTFLSELPANEIRDRVSKLPARSAIYYLSQTHDSTGAKIHPLEYLDLMTAVANAPTYSWVDSAMNHGIVGGSLYRQQDAIEHIGRLAVRVLRGDSPESIPVGTLHLNTNLIDWRQLQRWRIGSRRLPTGALVEFREPSVWERYRIRILAVAALLVAQSVLIAALLIQRARRRRAERELGGSQEELRRSYDRIRDLGAGLMRAQETERSRIARELHDDICQRMLLLTLDLESLSRGSADQTRVTGALSAARDIATSLHDLSHSLHPTRLRLIGLVPALEQLCAELSRSGLAIEFRHEMVPPKLPPDITLSVFRVVQEAVQNAIKHSGASLMSVSISGVSGAVALTIADNGVGFDVDKAWRKGVGLSSIAERLDAIGGELQIRSGPGTGTLLTAVVPVDVPQPAAV